MRDFKSHFRFNKQERSGIFFLLLIIVSLQVGYCVFKTSPMNKASYTIFVDTETQSQIDVLKKKKLQKDTVKLYPFNPNFITDYKGYVLGMSVDEIDRLHAFRKQNKFANTPEEFQKVTLISDSLLKAIFPYFKFPEWTQKASTQYSVGSNSNSSAAHFSPVASDGRIREEGIRLEGDFLDLNSATAEDLKAINGIGEKLSARIIKFRDRLGGFLIDEQIYDVYYLEPDVAERVLKKFKVFNKPVFEKININTASVAEIASLVYIKYGLAKEIVSYRETNGAFLSLNELENIEGFPADKIDRIALYLSL